MVKARSAFPYCHNGNQSELFHKIAERMTESFSKQFSIKRVTRKWQGLVDGFKKSTRNDKDTGRAPSRFQYVKEMEEMIGSRHDISFVVTGTQEDVVIHRTDELDEQANASSCQSPKPVEKQERCTAKNNDASTSQRTPTRKRKRDDDMVEYLKESDARAELREEKAMKEMQDFRGSFMSLFERIVEKM